MQYPKKAIKSASNMKSDFATTDAQKSKTRNSK